MKIILVLAAVATLICTQTANDQSDETQLTTHIYDVVIIGAGTSGIAASKELSAKGIPHLILEARDRIGGRVNSAELDGVLFDLGASFVHNPQRTNSMDYMVKQMGWPTIPAQFQNSDDFYQRKPPLTKEDEETAKKLLNQFTMFNDGYVKNRNEDIAIQAVWNQFYKSKQDQYDEKILEKVYYELLMEALLNGSDLNIQSAIYFSDSREKGTDDYLPKGTYHALLKAIFKRFCTKATLRLGEVVTKIDYSSQNVEITTYKGEFQSKYVAKKVISSLPLGVLKSEEVTFVPQLPADYQEAIESIGFGVMNKVVVSLSKYFWDKGTKVLNFIPIQGHTGKFLQCYVVSDESPSILMCFTGGSPARELSKKSDAEIVSQLVAQLKKCLKPEQADFEVENSVITRWDQDIFAQGAYSFYQVGTEKEHFQKLATPINSKLYFAGEHTEPKDNSNAHGAFKSGAEAGLSVASSLKKQAEEAHQCWLFC